jgi:hypothetical protein
MRTPWSMASRMGSKSPDVISIKLSPINDLCKKIFFEVSPRPVAVAV